MIEDLVKAVADQLPAKQASLVKQLMRGVLADATVSKANKAGGVE